jgi:hypothetical protein
MCGYVIFFEEGFNIGLLVDMNTTMGGVLEDLDAKAIVECSYILHRERCMEFTLGLAYISLEVDRMRMSST